MLLFVAQMSLEARKMRLTASPSPSPSPWPSFEALGHLTVNQYTQQQSCPTAQTQTQTHILYSVHSYPQCTHQLQSAASTFALGQAQVQSQFFFYFCLPLFWAENVLALKN